MTDFISRSQRVPVKEKYDIAIVGGGPAGVGAALAARRQRKKVLLVEKSVMLGGLATLGLIVFYNPPLDDGKGRKLVGGIAEELMHLSVKYGFRSLAPQWTKGVVSTEPGPRRYHTVFSAPAFALALIERLSDEGVDVLYDCLFTEAVMEGKRCTGIIVNAKAGGFYYPADAVIDASGDADVFVSAGAQYVENDDNWLSYWAQSTSLRKIKEAVKSGDIGKAVSVENLGAKADGADNPPGARRYGLSSPEEVSDFVIQGQKLALDRLKKMDKTCECLTALPGMAQYRKTRRIKGKFLLSEKDRLVHFDDSIGCVAEEWDAQCLLEIPYRTLITPDCENIFASGRNIASEGAPQDTTRLIAVAVQTGEAAGTAAALMLDGKCTAQGLDVAKLQKRLAQNGNILHF